MKYSDPVDATKPAMSLDVVDAVLEVAVSLAQIRLQQVPDDIFDVGAEVCRKPNLHSTYIRYCNGFVLHYQTLSKTVTSMRHLVNAHTTFKFSSSSSSSSSL